MLKLFDIFNHHSNINLVLEFMVGDMEQMLRGMAAQHKPLQPADIKAYMKMILSGIEHCHQNYVMHRDMKPGNLLLGENGGVKIGQSHSHSRSANAAPSNLTPRAQPSLV